VRTALRWAPVVAAAYVSLAAISVAVWGFPHRPVFDGQGPARPYRWVDPPPDLAETNQEPLAGSGRMPLDPTGSTARSIQTRDAQAQISFFHGAFPPADDRAVQVQVRPLDPDVLGPPPRGMRFDGNAYEWVATYEPSARTAELSTEVMLVLRYARHGTALLRWTGSAWERLGTDVIPASLAVFASTRELGTFVAAGPPLPPPRGFPWGALALLSGGAAVVAAVLGFRARRTMQRKQRGRTRAKPRPRRSS
jgi:hypothetical protein